MYNKELLISRMSLSGKSRKECADALHMHYNTFCSYLNGKRSWGVEDANHLCEYLGISDNNVKCAIFLS